MLQDVEAMTSKKYVSATISQVTEPEKKTTIINTLPSVINVSPTTKQISFKSGALGCQNCKRKFRFNNIAELLNGADCFSVSAAIAREMKCYYMDKSAYPFKDDDHRGVN